MPTVLKGWKNIPRGISLTFSLFAEIAGRDRETIDQARKNIFYSQLRKKTPLLPRYRGHPRPEKTACPHRRQLDAGWHHGAYLPPGKLRPRRMARYTEPPGKLRHQMWNIPFPELEYRLFTADPGYSALISAEPDRWDKAFRFVDGVCELHLYTNGVEEDHNPTPLGDVAQALINVVEENLL